MRMFSPKEKAEKAMAYIDEHFADADLCVQGIADAVGFGCSNLCMDFHKVIGMTMWDYVIESRLELAKKMLRETDKKIKDISVEIGYSTDISLMQVFRRECGEAPSEYRKRMRRE